MTIKVAVVGAGNIGCAIGVQLLHAGLDATLIARPQIAADIAANGLRLSDYRGQQWHRTASQVPVSTTLDAAREAMLVLLAVKCADVHATADALAPQLRRDALVVCLQNGIGSAERARARLPDQPVVSAIVPYNVARLGPGAYHIGTEGQLLFEAHPQLRPLAEALANRGIGAELRDDFVAVQWGKLLLNLNNAVNALSGLPLKAELSQHDFRRCLALAQREALATLQAAAIQPAKLTPIAPRWLPTLLSVPDAVFRVAARKMLAIDPLARSSMADDLQRGRATEVDYLNGAVVELARRLGREAPVNQRLQALVHAAEQGGSHHWSAAALLAQLSASPSPHTPIA